MAGTKPDDILSQTQESLRGSVYACTLLVKLSGGNANFLYRGTLAQSLPDGSTTVIIKHSAPFMATHPAFKLPSERSDFENRVLCELESLPRLSHAGITVGTPSVYPFTSAANTTRIYSDLVSACDMKTYLLTRPLTEPQCARLGYALGAWTRSFHQWATDPERAALNKSLEAFPVMKSLKYAVYYDKLVANTEKYPEILQECRGLFEDVARDARETFDRRDSSLIHGDFWTGNVLLQDAPFPAADGEAATVFVVDWEVSHLNSIAYDLGQMFAELFEVKHYRDIDAGPWLIGAFKRGYGGLEVDEAFRAAVHMGVHLIGYGSSVPGWGSEAQIQDIVKVGRDCVVHGWRKNAAFFSDTPLGCLFR